MQSQSSKGTDVYAKMMLIFAPLLSATSQFPVLFLTRPLLFEIVNLKNTNSGWDIKELMD